MKGSYILVINLKENKILEIGKLGDISFKKSFYVYVGSARNGLEQRIRRHLRNDKKMHWHIDYLLQNADVTKAFYKKNDKKEECNIVIKLASKLLSIPGFGCSDCKCKSHLFYGSKKDIGRVVNGLEMNQYFNANT